MSTEATDNDQPIAYVHAELCNIPAHAELEAKLACAEAERETWRDWLRLTDLVTANANAWKARAEAAEAERDIAQKQAKNWDYKTGMEHWKFSYDECRTKLGSAEAALNIIVDRATEWEMKHVETEAKLKVAREALEILIEEASPFLAGTHGALLYQSRAALAAISQGARE